MGWDWPHYALVGIEVTIILFVMAVGSFSTDEDGEHLLRNRGVAVLFVLVACASIMFNWVLAEGGFWP